MKKNRNYLNKVMFIPLCLAAHAFTPAWGSVQNSLSCIEFDQQASCASEPTSNRKSIEDLYQDLDRDGVFNKFYRSDVQLLASERMKRELTEKVFSQLREYSSQYACDAQVKVNTFLRAFDQKNIDEELTALGVALNDRNRALFKNDYSNKYAQELSTKKDELLQKLVALDKNINYCANHPFSFIAQKVAVIRKPCELVLTKTLPDNEYRLEPYLSQIKRTVEYQDAEKCLQGKLDSLEKVTILASSNQLNNTSSEFCKKDFLGLSKARAESAREVLLPDLLKGYEKTVSIDLDFRGKNKNGSSGPCPYQKTEIASSLTGEKLISGFKKNPELKNELQKGKYLILRFEFKEKENLAQSNIYELDQVLPCSAIRVSCGNN